MDLTPYLGVAGVTVLVLIGLGFIIWVVRTILGFQRGRPFYIIPDPDADEEDDADNQ